MIEVNAAELARVTKSLVGVTQARTMPILSHALLQLQGGRLSLTGSDMEIEISGSCPATGDDVSLCLPARQLHEAARNLPEGAIIKIDPSDSRAAITSGRSRWMLPSLPAEDYPIWEDSPQGEPVRLPADQFQAALKGSLYACAQGDVRYYLNGVYLQQDGANLQIIATDGHRMAVNAIPCQGEFDHIITLAAAKELSRFECADELIIQPLQRGIRWTCGGKQITCKTIDARYPDWRRVVPDIDKTTKVSFDRLQLRQAIDRLGVIKQGNENEGVRLIFDADSADTSQCSITFTNAEGASAEDQIPVNGALDLDYINLSLRYLGDLLANTSGESLDLHITDRDTSLMITEGGERPLHILMPMRG